MQLRLSILVIFIHAYFLKGNPLSFLFQRKENGPGPGICSMYDVCDTSKRLNCAGYVKAPILTDPATLASIKEMCGIDIAKDYNGYSCISPTQWSIVEAGLKIAQPLLSQCPACWKNFRGLWCEMSISPDQSLYVRTVEESISSTNGKPVATAINYYITPILRQKFFESCANVSMGMTNKKVLDVMFSSEASRDPNVLFEMMGKNSSMRSPYLIQFPLIASNDPEYELQSYEGASITSTDISPFKGNVPWLAPTAENIWPFNATMVPCDDPNYACVCVDCHKACPEPANWVSWAPAPCSIQMPLIGGVSCWNFGISTVYLFFNLILGAILLIRILTYTNNRRRSQNRTIDFNQDTQVFTKKSKSLSDGSKSTSTSVSSSLISETDVDVPFEYQIETLISKYFYAQGKWVATHVPIVLFVTFMLVVMSTVILIATSGLQIELDPVKLWVGPSSESAKQKLFYDENFGPFYRIAQVIIRTKNDSIIDNTKAVSVHGIGLIYDLLEKLQSLTLANDTKTLSDICFKPLGKECLIQSVALIWPSREDFEESSNWEADFNLCMKSPSDCLDFGSSSILRVPLMPELVVGGIPLNYSKVPEGAGGRPSPLPINPDNYIDARSLILTFLLDPKDSIQLKNSIEWEKKFISVLREFEAENPEFSWAYSAESSVEWEINRETEANAPVVVISYLAMFLYVAIALGRYSPSDKNCVLFRGMLAFGGVLLVAISILFSAAIFTLLGIKTTLIIAEVIPFLVLAVGVDNLFLLVQAFDSTECKYSIEERVALTIRNSGPSILVTELAELIAFGIGCFVGMPAVASFSMYAALAIACDIILQMTVFTAFLTIDGQRINDGKPDYIIRLYLFLKSFFSSKKDDEPNVILEAPRKIPPRWIENAFGKYVSPYLARSRKVQYCILFLYSFLLFFSFVGLGRIKLGLEQRLAVPTDSYLVRYFDALEQDLLVGPPVFFVLRNSPIENVQIQQRIASRFYQDINIQSIGSLVEVNKGEPGSFLASGISNWFDDFMAWGRECCYWNPTLGKRCSRANIPGCVRCIPPTVRSLSDMQLSSEKIDKLLVFFLSEMPSIQCPFAGGAAYADQVNGSVSSFKAYLQPLRTQDDFISSLKASKRIASILTDSLKSTNLMPGDTVEPEIFAFSPYFVFFDQYLNIIWVSILLCSVLLGVILLVTWLLLGCFRAALLSSVTVGSTAICLFGIMGWWDIGLSAVSLVNVVIAMGISVEFSSNMIRAYMVAPSASGSYSSPGWGSMSRTERVVRMCTETGSCVFLGITLTKLIGVSILYWSTSKIFEVFYFRMYMATVALSAFHGLALLPVLLALMGPSTSLKSKLE